MTRAIGWATLIAGTLDIFYAALMSAISGGGPAAMLRTVASGPFPAATQWGTGGSILGLLVHFTLIGIMATYFMVAARNWPAMLARPIQWGIFYGLVTYVVMNWVVVPLRFDTPLPPPARAVLSQLFAHVVLVGIPIALVATRMVRARGCGIGIS